MTTTTKPKAARDYGVKSMEDLVKLVGQVGWHCRKTKIGWFVRNHDGVGVSMSRKSSDWRAIENTAAELRQAGLFEALAILDEEHEAERLDALARDSRRAAAKPPPAATTSGNGHRPAPPPATFMPPVGRQRAAPAAHLIDAAGVETTLRPIAPGPMFTVTAVVTPEMASELYTRPAAVRSDGRPITQRRRDDDWVTRLAGMIERGEWQCTPEGLIIATDGGVLDGQHRLAAIIQAERPALMRITYNTDPDVFVVLNQGKRRTASDVLRIEGYLNTAHLGSAAKLLWCVRQYQADPNGPYYAPKGWARFSPSMTQLTAILDAEPGLVEHINPGAKMMAKIKGIPAAAAVFRLLAAEAWPACYHPPHMEGGGSMLDEFCNQIARGEMLKEKDPALTFRDWVVRGSGAAKATGMKREAQLIGLIKAWSYYAMDKPLGGIVVEPEVPLPKLYVPKVRGRTP